MISKKSARTLAVTLVATLAATVANASVTYSFTALSSVEINGESATGSFSVTVPDFITSAASFQPNQLDACSITTNLGPATCIFQRFLYNVGSSDTSDDDVISMGYTSPTTKGRQVFYYFAPDSFDHVGTYDSIVLGTQQQGILTVSLTSAVPEPGSAGLLLAGLGLLGFAGRRNRRR